MTILQLARNHPKRFIGKELHAPGYMHHFLFFSLCFSLEDYSSGYCEEISLVLTRDNFISVENDGMSIPIEINHEWPAERIFPGSSTSPEGATYLELSMSTFHFISHDAYLKYFKEGPSRDGLFPINAFSSECRVTLWKDGYEWRQEYISDLPILDFYSLINKPISPASPQG